MTIFLITDAIATGAGQPHKSNTPKRTIQATVVGDGAVTATVLVEGRNNGVDWLTLATITLSGTDSDSDGVALESPWAEVRAECTAVTGTDATLNVVLETQK